MSEIIKVGMADLKTCRVPDGLTTLGLGSCVGVVIRDTVAGVGGMAHVMLPDSTAIRGDNLNIAKFADTAIVELVRQMEFLGAKRNRMEAKMAGGASMFAFKTQSSLVKIGERNAEACHAKLKELGIPVRAEDTGKDYGRTIIYYPETGVLEICAVGKNKSYI